jgi:diguanylate cyclase (GGDEF)-like protein
VCRWGGEEFTVLLPQTDLANAVHLAECLRALSNTSGAAFAAVTISIGVAQHTAEETTESLLRRADAALYQAKAAGRNRVVTA